MVLLEGLDEEKYRSQALIKGLMVEAHPSLPPGASLYPFDLVN